MNGPWPPQRFRDFAYAVFLTLYKQFPLLSLRTDEDREKAMRVLEFFDNRKPAPSQGEQEYIDVLKDLVLAYDTKPKPVVQEPQETPQEPTDDFDDDPPPDSSGIYLETPSEAPGPSRKGRRR